MPRREVSGLSHNQVAVAQRIHAKLNTWRSIDDALRRLHERYPGFTLDACMVKVATVNALYSTYVLAVSQMAEHVHHVFGRKEFQLITKENSTTLVETIADLKLAPQVDRDLDPDDPPPHRRPRERQFRSFASKFCAFFVNAELFPIYDEAAREAMKYHLARHELDSATTYIAFVKNIDALRVKYGLQANGYREIDRYLWLRGMHDRHIKNDRRINGELKQYFRENHPELATLLRSR